MARSTKWVESKSRSYRLRNKIPEAYRPAIKAAFRYYTWCGATLCVDDLVQVGMFAIDKAASSFDPTQGEWYPFAYRRAMTAVHRESKLHSHAISIPRRQGVFVRSLDVLLPGRDDVTELDTLESPETYTVEVNQILRQAQKVLNPREYEAFWEYWVENLPLKEIGDKLGVSFQRAGVIVKTSEEKIRASLI